MGDFDNVWHAVETLSRRLSHEWRLNRLKFTPCVADQFREKSQTTKTDHIAFGRASILKKIEDVILTLTHSIAKGESPVFKYNNTSSWENVRYHAETGLELGENRKLTHVRFESLQSIKKFGLMTRLLSIIYKLIQQNKYCTKRDIYYQYPELFGSQSTLDHLVDNIACMLETPRWELHVLATCKGSVAGDLCFHTDQGHLIECLGTRTGIQIPAHTKDVQNVSTTARFVLIVEKDAIFQKLVDNNFCQKFGPCILVTGKGFPDLGTRLLLRRLWDEFQLPMFVLVDADPHGIEIMAVYRFGSKAQAAENRYLAVPSIRWIGILPTDIDRLNIPESACLSFTKKDMDKITELQSRPYTQDNWQLMEQVQSLLQGGRKVEIQCLDSLSPTYLCDVYLPSKLRCGAWI